MVILKYPDFLLNRFFISRTNKVYKIQKQNQHLLRRKFMITHNSKYPELGKHRLLFSELILSP